MLHNNLRRLMSEQGLNTEAVLVKLHAADCQVTFGTVASWVRGSNVPSLENARALAGVLGCTLDALTDDAAA